jgi:thiamine biosynthesis lipoprotein
MGTTVQVVVVGGAPALVDHAQALVGSCEARWSRFRPDSELSALNQGTGVPVLVSPETLALVRYARDAWYATGGRFDPTVHDAVVAAGYDRSFAEVVRRRRPVAGGPARPAPGAAGIVVDEVVGAVTVPAGIRLDLGGIAKGFTADLVTGAIIEAGAAGCALNVGGDLRVRGTAPGGGRWRVELMCPGAEVTVPVELVEGAVCTSTRLRRRWPTTTGAAHHLIDPATGRPTASGLASVSVVAARAAQAEVLAKAAFIAGPDEAPRLLAERGATGLLVTDDGACHPLAGLAAFRPGELVG